ncbi:MAG TPA: SWIM zinc finger family protein [Acidimicrobiia bacterium]|nr:SWIM zinc finger family protein [Acidimicrobiia bacterium]
MAGRWTVDDVLALAPDGASAGAARRLSLSPVWSQAGSSGSLVWGRCQGSAREPYQVTVDLIEPSFRCTCPSRKHPCKHGLALLLLWAEGDGSVAEEDRPAGFAAEWVQRVAAARGAPGTAAAGGRDREVDPEAAAKRLAQRVETMSAGLDEFERWLFDLVRQGLASARHQPFSFWDDAAARLVDAQMPGLAERVRALPALLYASTGWADRLLAELARGYLAVAAWRRRDLLPEAVLADLRVVLGWARRVDEVLDRGERVTDRWAVVGLAREEDTRLQSQRTWLVGETTGRVAVVLDFAAAGATLAVAAVLGSVVEAELALYPGSEPRRALFTGERAVVGSAAGLPAMGIDASLDRVADWVAANPFADRFPVALAGVVPVADGARSLVAEPGVASLPLNAGSAVLTLLALSGGHPVDVFGEWNGYDLTPLSVAADGSLVSL